MDESEEKLCLCCKKRIVGRSDKKFCSDECRTLYNNRRYRSENREMLKIDHILKKNRSILSKLYYKGKTRSSILELISLGFNFDFITSVKPGIENGSPGFGCYEYYCTIYENGNINLYKNQIILQ